MTEYRRTRFRYCLIIICLLCIVSGISGCVQDRYENASNGKLKIAATIFPYYDFVRQIGQDYVDVQLIVPAGRDSHSFEPTPADMITIEEADMFLYNGGEMEKWLDHILDAAGNEDRTVIRMMDYVQTDKEVELEGMLIRGAEEEEEFDEHIWTSPKNAKLIVRVISDTLQQIDPEHKEIYEHRTEEYLSRLDDLDQTFESVTAQAENKIMIFGDKFPFYYFARDYGLECYAAFPGCSTETEPSAATMAYLINKVEEQNISVVYYLELSSHKVADAIGAVTDAQALLFHSCHNVTRAEFDAGVTYLDLMYQNAEKLRKGICS